MNYPTEWWHWSYGDRYWALVDRRATPPLYGPPSDGSRGRGRRMSAPRRAAGAGTTPRPQLDVDLAAVADEHPRSSPAAPPAS